MNYSNNLKNFELNNKIFYYYVKDIEFIPKEIHGVEMARATMVVYEDFPYEVFGIYDESIKIQHAMPNDAKRWYEGYLRKNKQ